MSALTVRFDDEGDRTDLHKEIDDGGFYCYQYEGREIGFLKRKWNSNIFTFLDQTTISFRGTVRRSYSKQGRPLSISWLSMSNDMKNRFAFGCRFSDWNELRAVASNVLKIHVSREKSNTWSSVTWDFVFNTVTCVSNLDAEPSLFTHNYLACWRSALIRHFGPEFIDLEEGVEIISEHAPECIRDYIPQHQRTKITIELPTHHEVLEARLSLERWAREERRDNYCPDAPYDPIAEQAERLLAL